jgi:ankyrin repeat protein
MENYNIIKAGNLEKFNEWLKTNQDFNEAYTMQMTPINYASHWGRFEIVKLLLVQPGIDLNVPDSNENTPIIHAACFGHTEIVKLLLTHPAIDIKKIGRFKKNPLQYALANGHTDIVHILQEYERNPTKMRYFYMRKYFPHIIEEYFILIVLAADDYFICTDQGKFGRFFKIVIVLPQELQALIANRIVNSSGDTPRSKFIEDAIKKFLN